jgi:hypothetical protein
MGVRGNILRFSRLVAAVAAVAAILPGAAFASELIDRDATGVKLAVNKKGQALLTYKARGKTWHVLAWGAVNGLAPTRSRPQVSFKLDYAGGWGTSHKDVWKTFKNSCSSYDGPELAWFVTGCTASDGSYWAIQSWQRMLPNLGYVPWLSSQRVWELRLAHWTGPTAQIESWTDWIYSGRFEHLFGRLTYQGQPVYGFKTTSTGAPLDTYGRNLYLDTFNSAYGSGWKRENSFVAHNPTGVFCYGFYEFKPYAGYPRRPTLLRGDGEQYRMTVIGPGVSPDVMWQGSGLHTYDRQNSEDVAYEKQMNSLLDQVSAGDGRCHQH